MIKVEIVFGILMILILVISGCDNYSDYSSDTKRDCQKLCLQEGLTYERASRDSDGTVNCYCQKILRLK